MGARSGSSGSGFGGTSDAAIARAAAYTPTKEDMQQFNPMNNSRVLKGEIAIMGNTVYIPKIENEVQKVLGSRPARPKTSKDNPAFVKAYDAWSPKMDAAYSKAIHDYKKEFGTAKSKGMKHFMAKKVLQYKQYLSEQPETKAWIHKKFSRS